MAQSWVTGFVGTDAPAVLSWDAVRRELVTQACLPPRPRDPLRASRTRGDRPVPSQLGRVAEELDRNSVPPRPGIAADERGEDVAAFDVLGAALRSEHVLVSEGRRLPSNGRQMLLDQLELGIRARRHLLDSYRYLPEAIVAEYENAERPASELLEAGMAELNEAISHFARWRATSPPGTQWKTLSFLVFATKRIRDAMSQLTMDRGA